MTTLDDIRAVSLVFMAFTFALVDNLFLGNFVWNAGGPVLFFVVSIISIPITTLFKYHSYDSLFRYDKWDIFKELKTVHFMLIFALGLSLLFHFTVYGALYIQILRLLSNQLGILPIISSNLTFYLVVISIVPDIFSYALDLYEKLKLLTRHLTLYLKGEYELGSIKNPINVIFCVMLTLFVSAVFTNIDYTQLINSHQHYLIEVSNMLIPHVFGKDVIFWLLLTRYIAQFWDLGRYIFNQLSIIFHKDYSLSFSKSLNIGTLLFLSFVRGVAKFILAGELASNPYHIDAKSLAMMSSVIDDADQYRCNMEKGQGMIKVGYLISYMLIITSITFLSLTFMGLLNINYGLASLVLLISLTASYTYPPTLVRVFYDNSLSSNADDFNREKQAEEQLLIANNNGPDMGLDLNG